MLLVKYSPFSGKIIINSNLVHHPPPQSYVLQEVFLLSENNFEIFRSAVLGLLPLND